MQEPRFFHGELQAYGNHGAMQTWEKLFILWLNVLVTGETKWDLTTGKK